jgi:hypothetical protein
MRKKSLLFFILVSALLFIPAVFAAAQYDLSDATDDLNQVADALSSIFGPNLGGMSYVGDPVGYSVVPRVEFGISGGMVFVPLENINTGTDLDVDFGDMGKLAALPIPAASAHAKFTISKKFEMGVKVAGIPEIKNEDAGVSISNLIIGGKFRYNLLSYKAPLIKGGISVGALYEYMNGGILLTQSGSTTVDPDDNPATPNGTLTTTGELNTEWNSNTFGGEAQANLQVIFLNFFVGTRVSKTFGKATTSLKGTSTLEGDPSIFDEFTDELVDVTQEAKPQGIDPYVFGGVELKILGLVLTGKGTYNVKNESYIIESGLRLQF